MPGSVRTIEVVEDNNAGNVTAAATTVQELIGTIPFAYQVRLGDHLMKKYRIAHKHANVQSTLTLYERHLTDNSAPPVLRNSIKEPKLQFAKEFLSTNDGSKAPELFKDQVAMKRKELLKAAIELKKQELGTLANLIKAEPAKWQEVCRVVAKHTAESNGGRMQQGPGGQIAFQGLPEAAKNDFDGMIHACNIYTYRVIAIARASIDRAEIQKIAKLQLKEATDVEMTDIHAREPAMRDVIREEMKALEKRLSQSKKKPNGKPNGRVQKNSSSGKKTKPKGGKKGGKGKKSR